MRSLYVVLSDLSPEENAILSAAGFSSGEIVWLHASRPARMGLGPWGTFSKTYESRSGFHSPIGRQVANMPMRYFKKLE